MGYDKLRLMFDVKQLRVLKAVAEHGSFSAAADALSYTQPAISQQIAALEKRAGTTLVDRGSRGVRLTDAGRALVEHAEVVIARLAAAEAELEAIAGVRGGRVRLVVVPHRGRVAAAARGRRVQRTPPRGGAELRGAGARGGGPDAARRGARDGDRVRVRPLNPRSSSASTRASSSTTSWTTRCTSRCRATTRSRASGACGSRTSPTRPGSRRPARTAGAAASTRRPVPRRASTRRSASGPTTTTWCRA